MKLVILDGYTENPGDLSWDGLRELAEVTVYDRTSLTDPAQTIARIADAEIVLTNKTPLPRAVFEACPNIKMVGVLATGYNVVDIACARERGIPVCNVPAYGTASVSQYAIALLLEACHHIGHHSDAVHAGRWASCPDWCFWDYPLIELEHKTIGIIGFCRIGQSTGRIAKALGMRVLAYDVFPTDAGRAVGEYVDLDTLLAASDVIALHCNLTPENEKIICRENIAKMKDGVILVNNARGQLVAEQDLADALNSGKVAAAALDVVSTEPIRSDNPLLQAKTVSSPRTSPGPPSKAASASWTAPSATSANSSPAPRKITCGGKFPDYETHRILIEIRWVFCAEASSVFWFGGCLSCIALRSITRIKTARSSCGWPGNFMGSRADDAVGLELLFGDDVHVGHLADAELFGQAVVIEAGAAGQDLDALALQRLQILERGRAFTGDGRAGVVKQDRRGQRLLLREREQERLEQGSAELLVPLAHVVGRDDDDGLFLRRRGSAGDRLLLRQLRALRRGDGDAVFGVRDRLDLDAAALALGQPSEILHRRFIVDQRLHAPRAAERLQRPQRLHDRQRAGLPHRIDPDHNPSSFVLLSEI